MRSAERELWSAVILMATADLCTDGPGTRGTGPVDRYRAEKWVGNYPNRNFRMVCHMAGVDPEVIHPQLKAVVAMPMHERIQWAQRAGVIVRPGAGRRKVA